MGGSEWELALFGILMGFSTGVAVTVFVFVHVLP